MSESLRLVHEANNLMDSIDEKQEHDAKNLEDLNHLKTKMLSYGFNAPLKDIIAKATEQAQTKSADELADQKKQMGRIRYIASLKKFTLNRLRVAIAAHKIANALEDFKLEQEIKFLPLGGSYKQSLTKSGETAVNAYHELINLFEQRKNPLRSASAVIEFMQDGVEVERTIQLDADVDAKKKIADMFGADAKIKEVELKKKTAGLIKNYSTKVALFTMVAVSAAKKAEQKSKTEEQDDLQITQYNQILRHNGLVADSDITQAEGFDKIKKELIDKKFIIKNGFDLYLDEELEPKLYKRREKRRRDTLQDATNTVFRLLSWYYISMHEQARKSYSSLPSIIAMPEQEHLQVLNDLASPTNTLTNIADAVYEKMQFEKKAPPISSKAWGPAFLCIKKDIDSSIVATQLNLSKEEIESAIPLVKTLMQKPQGRAAQFLDGLKK
jgi:Zn-finger domain-containing protein